MTDWREIVSTIRNFAASFNARPRETVARPEIGVPLSRNHDHSGVVTAGASASDSYQHDESTRLGGVFGVP